MKKWLQMIKTSASILLVCICSASPASTQNKVISTQTMTPASIDKNGVLILIRSSLYALELANKSYNYSIIRDIGAPDFAAINDSARLSDIFKKLREEKTDLSGVLAYGPQLTLMPQIDKDGMLHMNGFFPSPTTQINFRLVYAPVQGRWKIFEIAAYVSPAEPFAPTPHAAVTNSIPATPAKTQFPVKSR